MRMRQETFKKSYYIPAFGKSIEIRRNQDIDEDGILGKELLAQYGEDCILEGETKSLMEKVASGDIGGTSLTTEQTEALTAAYNSKSVLDKLDGLQSSASKIDGKVIPIDTIALLRAKTVAPSTVWVSGYHTKGDGAFGSNIFEWDAASTEPDNSGTIIKLDSITIGRYKIKANTFNVSIFGAIGDGITDDTLALQSAELYSQESGLPCYYSKKTYITTDTIIYKSVKTNFNGATINYKGGYKKFAVVFEGVSSTLQASCRFENLIVLNENATEPDSDIEVKTVSLPSSAPALVVAAIIGNTAPSVTVPFLTALIGDMIVLRDYTLSSDKIGLTGVCETDGVVTIYVNNYDQVYAYVGESVSINIEAIHNPLHGINIAGGLSSVSGIRVIGFTGLSVGIGSGVCSISGVELPSTSGRCYYNNIDVQISSGAGYGIEIPSRNNANTFKITTFPYNLYQEATERRASSIHQVIVSGIANVFERVSLEATSSSYSMLIDHWANGNDFSKVYFETSTTWVNTYTPEFYLKSTSSETTLPIRGAGDYIDKGESNSVSLVSNNYINGHSNTPSQGGDSLVYNGDFENGLNGWKQYSTAVYEGVVDGLVGKAVRFSLSFQELNLSQLLPIENNSENIALSCYVRSDVVIGIRTDGRPNGKRAKGTGEWEHISTIAKGNTVQIRTEGPSTGYVEVCLVTASLGIIPIGTPKRTNNEIKVNRAIPVIAPLTTHSEVITMPGASKDSFFIAKIAEKTWGAMVYARWENTDTIIVDFFNPQSTDSLYISTADISVLEIKSDRYSPR